MDGGLDLVSGRPVRSRAVFALAVLCAGTWAASPAMAQDAADGGWHYVVEPYLMFPNMQGTAGIGVLPDVEVDEDPGDIFSNLQIGAMLYLEANNGTWALSSDLLYMKLESGLPAGTVVSSGKAQMAQLGWELALLRRVSPWLELGAALSYNAIDAELDLNLNTPGGVVSRSGDKDEDWVDPSLLARATFPLSDKWFLRGRANIGGFGVGSDLMWQIQVDAGYRFSGRSYMTLGYRVIDVDYEHGSGTDRFKYDIATFGPVLRFGFNF